MHSQLKLMWSHLSVTQISRAWAQFTNEQPDVLIRELLKAFSRGTFDRGGGSGELALSVQNIPCAPGLLEEWLPELHIERHVFAEWYSGAALGGPPLQNFWPAAVWSGGGYATMDLAAMRTTSCPGPKSESKASQAPIQIGRDPWEVIDATGIYSDSTKTARIERAKPPRERAKRALEALYPHGIPDQATVGNKKLVGIVDEWLQLHQLPEVSRDSVMRAANRRTDRERNKSN